jgi:hypothetical protein
MADVSPGPMPDARLREYLDRELRRAEIDFPDIAQPRRSARRRWSVGAVPAVAIAVVVAATALIGGIRLIGSVASGPAAASSVAPLAASPSAESLDVGSPLPSKLRLVPPVMVGEWTANCNGVAVVDCRGSVERFVNLLARDAAGILDESGGLLDVTSRPVCPPVQAWADGSECWQVSARGATWPAGGAICMVIARRGSDLRYPPYVQVGGEDGTGRAGGMPAGWPSCN